MNRTNERPEPPRLRVDSPVARALYALLSGEQVVSVQSEPDVDPLDQLCEIVIRVLMHGHDVLHECDDRDVVLAIDPKRCATGEIHNVVRRVRDSLERLGVGVLPKIRPDEGASLILYGGQEPECHSALTGTSIELAPFDPCSYPERVPDLVVVHSQLAPTGFCSGPVTSRQVLYAAGMKVPDYGGWYAPPVRSYRPIPIEVILAGAP